MEKKTGKGAAAAGAKTAAPAKKPAAKAKAERPAAQTVRRFVFECGERQKGKTVTREGCTLLHESGARFGNIMQSYAEEFPSVREAEEAVQRIAEEYVDDGYRELSESEGTSFLLQKRFSVYDDDLRALFCAQNDTQGDALKDADQTAAEKVLKLIYDNRGIETCKQLELCFAGQTLAALVGAWHGAPLKNMETLILRVPEGEPRSVDMPFDTVMKVFPKLSTLRLSGKADWSLSGGEFENLKALYVEGDTFALPSARLPRLTELQVKLAQAVSLASGASFGPYENWRAWCEMLSKACPHVERLAVEVDYTETNGQLLNEILRPAVFGRLTELEVGSFVPCDGDELCGVLAQNMARLTQLTRLTLHIAASGDAAPLLRRLQAFPLPLFVKSR